MAKLTKRERNRKRKEIAKKKVDRQVKKAEKDGKVSPREIKRIKKISESASLNSNYVKKSFAKQSSAKGPKIRSKKSNQPTVDKPVVSKDITPTSDDKTPESSTPSPTKTAQSKKSESFNFKRFLDNVDAVPSRQKITGKKWNPDDIESGVKSAWKERTESITTSPKRLKVNVGGTPDRLKDPKFQTDGKFDSSKYSTHIRQKMANRYAKRGGSVKNAIGLLGRSTAKMPKAMKPKYGGAIEGLRKKFANINYNKKIEETTDKLTKKVGSGASDFKKTGMSILKRRSSEDGALPSLPRIKGVKDNTEGTGRPLPQNKGVDPRAQGGGRPLPQKKGEPLSQNIVRENKEKGKRGVEKRLRAALQGETKPGQLKRIRRYARSQGLKGGYVDRTINKQGRKLLQKK